MSVYAVHGKLRVGKTKFAVWMAQRALREGLRVASNVDLYLDKITPERSSRYVRIPDKPSPWDLDAIGHGNPESYDEERNGVLILDELGTWLNARTFQDKSRGGVIDWLIHSGKLGWHIYLIVQDVGMIDKQVREALVEYDVRVMRMDKVRFPIVGKLLGAVGRPLGFKRWGYFPRFHMATARVGYGANAIVAERWTYRGDELHAAYDTRQKFSVQYPHGPHSVLPAWEFEAPPTFGDRVRSRVRRFFEVPARPSPVLGVKHPLVAKIERCLPAEERARHVSRLARLGYI